MTDARTGSRLHFGMFSVPGMADRWPDPTGGPGTPVRHYGGVGLMVREPVVSVTVERASEWSATGPLAPRALSFARAFDVTLPRDQRSGWRIRVDECPPEHAGLGVGTQLGLTVGRAMSLVAGLADLPAAGLALRVGRGLRSGIGVHGFEGGGLIVEAGRPAGGGAAPLVARADWPAEWPVVLARPDVPVGLHGGAERGAFERLARGDDLSAADPLCRLVLLGLLPALAERDLPTFGAALTEFNARVGERFAAEQGGRYADPAVAGLIKVMLEAGAAGAGQSSWGPTVFAVCGDDATARAVAAAVPAGTWTVVTGG